MSPRETINMPKGRGDMKEMKSACCDVEMVFAGENDFRIGGMSPGWKLVFGRWAEATEDIIPLGVYICPKCGRVEFYANEKTRQHLGEKHPQNMPESEFARVLRGEPNRT